MGGRRAGGGEGSTRWGWLPQSSPTGRRHLAPIGEDAARFYEGGRRPTRKARGFRSLREARSGLEPGPAPLPDPQVLMQLP